MTRKVVLTALTFFITSCSSHQAFRNEYISTYHQGQLERTEICLSEAIDTKIPSNDFKKSKDAVWLLLDRATSRFARGDTPGAILDYNKAIEAIDYCNQSSLAENISQMVVQDDVAAYNGDDFEQVLARVYLALALFQEGDDSNAYALLRQAENAQQKIKETYAQHRHTAHYSLVDNTVAKYLLAVVSEKRGDYSNATILYNQINFQVPDNSQIPVNCATVLVIAHNGNAPYKISGTCNGSEASGVLLEMMLSSSSRKLNPALSSLVGIPVPVLCQKFRSDPIPIHVALDDNKKMLLPIYDVKAIAYAQLEQKKPAIVARGVARLLSRRAAVAGFQQNDQCLGALADFGMFVANLNTKADTRSWSTLPSSIDVARFDVAEGVHGLKIASYAQPLFQQGYTLNLKPYDLCIINLFIIHPGVVYIQIPKRFLPKENFYDS